MSALTCCRWTDRMNEDSADKLLCFSTQTSPHSAVCNYDYNYGTFNIKSDIIV